MYDVCADDHCQRYQGITRTYGHEQAVREAIEATWGEVLTYDGTICDARFSKCCGGVSEAFESCWEEVPHPYLIPVRDSGEAREIPDLTDEAAAERWITTHPESYCDTQDPTVLGQVLNGYDRETSDFYRWQVSYTAEELSELVAPGRSGIDFGTILNLIPVERGASGRLIRLKIVGTKRAMVIGKELEIRRILSETHLYSSAFVVRREGNRFILLGAGMGTWSRSLSDRCSRDGSERDSVRPDIAPLLYGSPDRKVVRKRVKRVLCCLRAAENIGLNRR